MEKNCPVLYRGAHRCGINEADMAGTRGTHRACGGRGLRTTIQYGITEHSTYLQLIIHSSFISGLSSTVMKPSSAHCVS